MYHSSVTLQITVMVFSWDWECAVKVQAERLSCPVCWLELGMRMMPLLHADLPPTPRSIIPAPVARRTSFTSFSSPKHFRCFPPSIYQLDFCFYPFIFFCNGTSTVQMDCCTLMWCPNTMIGMGLDSCFHQNICKSFL